MSPASLFFGDRLASLPLSASLASVPNQIIETVSIFQWGTLGDAGDAIFPNNKGETEKNTRGRKRTENGEGMTYQFALSFPWRDWAAGAQGCETFAIAAQHPRGYYGVFYGETALTIGRQSQSDEVLTREPPQQPSS